MSEQKVWVENMPESCDECKYYTQFTDGMGCMVAQELRPMDEQDNYMQEACPLHSIKTHDRELVKEVCEDLTKSILNLKYVNDTREFATYVLSIIKSKQKDFEK